MVAGELAFGVTSVCWTAKQPPKGPAAALLKQRTVQTFPVEAEFSVRDHSPFKLMAGQKGHTSNASHVRRHRDGKSDVPINRVRLFHSEVCLSRHTIRIARQVHITSIWSRAISTSLTNRHSDCAALCDRRDGLVRQLVFGVLADVDVACEQSPPALVDDIGVDLGLIDDVCVGLGGVNLEAWAGWCAFRSLGAEEDALAVGYCQNGRSRVENLFQR